MGHVIEGVEKTIVRRVHAHRRYHDTVVESGFLDGER
jgi:hypothetical protein